MDHLIGAPCVKCCEIRLRWMRLDISDRTYVLRSSGGRPRRLGEDAMMGGGEVLVLEWKHNPSRTVGYKSYDFSMFVLHVGFRLPLLIAGLGSLLSHVTLDTAKALVIVVYSGQSVRCPGRNQLLLPCQQSCSAARDQNPSTPSCQG